MQSDEWEEFAILLQMEEWSKATGRSTKSLATPDFQAIAADLKELRPLDEHLSEVQKQHSEKLLTEQQLREDEEIARQFEQSLQIEEWSEVKDRNTISQVTLNFPVTAADRRSKQELRLCKSLSEEQKQESEKLVKEQQQIWQDEELAWRMEHGCFSEDQYDLFFAESMDDRGYVGVGCVIKDTEGQVVFEHRECIGLDLSHYFAEYNALSNGLDVARSIGLRHINAHGNRAFIYWEVEGQVEAPGNRFEQFGALQERIKELDSFNMNCVSRTENQDAIKLASYAAEHAPRMKRKNGLGEVGTRPQCLICLENIFPPDIVCQKECRHKFCFDCLSQHVETEVSGRKVPVRCPQFFDCARYMDDNDCMRLSSPKLFDTYSTRLTEATISDLDKVYCPFPGCSALMTHENKTNMYAASSSRSTPRRTNIGSAECMECHRLFCVECHVPWHAGVTCERYQNLPPDERDVEDRKLFQLANDQKWRRCGQCRSLIVLAEGCFHMTCRCGNEFCYTCGANYRNKKKTCECELFPVAMVRARRLL